MRRKAFMQALLAAAGAPAWVRGAAGAEPAAPLRLNEVAPGVYMAQGATGEPDETNLGRIGNAGFIVGDSGVLAIDSGTSYRHGLALLAAIKGVTPLPVRAVVLTHARQEFLFGATAYREQGVSVRMHRLAAGLMRSRCERCLKTLRQLLGEDAMQGTALPQPDDEFSDTHTLALTGRPAQVLYHGHSSGAGDVAVFDATSGVLFAGGLLDHLRIPDVQDADLAGWTGALAALRRLPIKLIVPGHGPAAPPAAIPAIERYLAQLRGRVLELLRSGVALSEVADAASLPEFAAWDRYETIHRRNASVLFVRLEREQMFKLETTP